MMVIGIMLIIIMTIIITTTTIMIIMIILVTTTTRTITMNDIHDNNNNDSNNNIVIFPSNISLSASNVISQITPISIILRVHIIYIWKEILYNCYFLVL